MKFFSGNNVTDLIGDTPILKLMKSTDSSSADIFVKLEYLNPGGSIKDRIALSMIERAEAEGQVQSESTVIEASSGNTGIALSMVCAFRGYRCIITMPEALSLERINILRSYGAEVVLTPSQSVKRMNFLIGILFAATFSCRTMFFFVRG